MLLIFSSSTNSDKRALLIIPSDSRASIVFATVELSQGAINGVHSAMPTFLGPLSTP